LGLAAHNKEAFRPYEVGIRHTDSRASRAAQVCFSNSYSNSHKSP